jgi:hypothetical protein
VRDEAELQQFLTGGLCPVSCAGCGVSVLVKKNSPEHTSIQWTPAATAGCAEFAAQGGSSALIDTCHTLRASIDASVLAGSDG